MDQAILSIKKLIESSGFRSYFICEVRKADSSFKSKIFVSINDRCLMTFDHKGHKITNTFSWLRLSEIKKEGSKLRFTFHKIKYAIEFSDNDLLKAVSEALQRILHNHELKEIGWPSLNLPKLPYSPSTPINRIIERSFISKFPINSSMLTALKPILEYSQPSFSLKDIPHFAECSKLFFEALPMFAKLKSLTISLMKDFEPYQNLISFIPYIIKLKRFEINAPKTKEFIPFINSFTGKNHHLFSVSFRKSGFDENDVIKIRDFVIGRMIKCIELHDAIQPTAFSAFYHDFLKNDLISNILVLNLEGSKGIDINFLIPKIKDLKCLSLANCGIDVSEALQKLANHDNLRMLDLSNNSCRTRITALPKNVISLYLNNVSWGIQTISVLITHLPNYYMSLWISNISTNDAEWQNFFVALLRCKNFPLESFTYDNNRIHPNLFKFLLENRDLDTLSLCGCLTENDTECIDLLCAVIQRTLLRKLYLRGTKDKFIGKAIDKLVRSVIVSKLEYFDITLNNGGDYGMNKLMPIVRSTNFLKKLIFDGTKTETPNLLIDFSNEAKKKQLKVSYPHNDISRLLKKKLITPEIESQIKELYRDSANGPISRQFHSNDFPLYLRNSQIDELSKPVELVPPRSPKQTEPAQQQSPAQNQTQPLPNVNQRIIEQRQQQEQFKKKLNITTIPKIELSDSQEFSDNYNPTNTYETGFTGTYAPDYTNAYATGYTNTYAYETNTRTRTRRLYSDSDYQDYNDESESHSYGDVFPDYSYESDYDYLPTVPERQNNAHRPLRSSSARNYRIPPRSSSKIEVRNDNNRPNGHNTRRQRPLQTLKPQSRKNVWQNYNDKRQQPRRAQSVARWREMPKRAPPPPPDDYEYEYDYDTNSNYKYSVDNVETYKDNDYYEESYEDEYSDKSNNSRPSSTRSNSKASQLNRQTSNRSKQTKLSHTKRQGRRANSSQRRKKSVPRNSNNNSSTTRKRRPANNQESPDNLIKTGAKPIIRNKRGPAKRKTIPPAYVKPSWEFPIKINFVLEDDQSKKIEKAYSTVTLVEDALKKTIPQIRS